MKHQKLNDPLTEHLGRVQNSSGTQLIQEMVSHMYEGRTKGDLLDFYVRPGGYGYDEKRPRAETLAALDKAYATWLKEIGKKGNRPSDYRSRNEAEEDIENAKDPRGQAFHDEVQKAVYGYQIPMMQISKVYRAAEQAFDAKGNVTKAVHACLEALGCVKS
jgi:hypothetical protein